MKVKAFTNKQQGAVTLLTALVLLISITLISLFTAKTVLVETQMTADNYRTSQATAAASAAMDQAVAYFSAGGLDQHKNATPATLTADCKVDYIGSGANVIRENVINGDCLNSGVSNVVVIVSAEPTAASCSMPATSAFPLTLTSGTQTILAQFYFNNTDDNACDCQSTATEDADGDGDGDCMGTLGTNMTRALVTAKGWSDDCTAVRTITQCVGTYKIFRGDGPQQPFVSKAGVGLSGSAKIINRYNNSSIWSGGADVEHGSYDTYLRPSGTEVADYTPERLDSEDKDADTQPVSNTATGNGIDVVTSDPTLSSKTSDQFFDMFFAQTKSEIKNAADAAGQKLAADVSPAGLTGLIWVDGGTAVHNGVVGSSTQPAILIVNGDLDLNGGLIYGIVYVTGKLKINGNSIVKGSVVSENGSNRLSGTLTLVYKPWGDDGTNQEPQFITGTGTVIAGSWKDW